MLRLSFSLCSLQSRFMRESSSQLLDQHDYRPEPASALCDEGWDG